MNTKQYFSDLKSALEQRNAKIKELLERYRAEAGRISARYSEAVAAVELKKLENSTRAAIADADQSAHDVAEKVIEHLQAALMEYITGGADPALLAQLQAAKAFDLKISHAEVEAMAKGNSDPITLACLAQVAKSSGFELTYTTTKELEADLTTIMSVFNTPSLYTPDDLLSEALICHPNRMYQNVDYGRPDALSISTRAVSHMTAPARLDEMADRWSNPGAVTIKQMATA